jgi:hypothetical protein
MARVYVFVWQFELDYPDASGTHDDRTLPARGFWVKTHAGATWMGRISRHPAAPRGADGVMHLARVYGDQGFEFWPWCEAQGRALDAEIARGREVMQALKAAGLPARLVVDFEVESTGNFWLGSREDAVRLMAELAQEGEVWLCHYQDRQIWLDDLAPHVTGFVTQDYWPDFRTTPEAQLLASTQRLARFDKPVIYGLPASAPPDELGRALRWLAERGARGALWRRGTATAATWAAIQDAPDGDHARPVPPEAVLQFRIDRALECLTGNFVAAQSAIDQLLHELSGDAYPRVAVEPLVVTQAPTAPRTTAATTARARLSRLRRHLPHPWIVAAVATATTAAQAIMDAIAEGRLILPNPIAHAAAIAILPLLVRLLRQEEVEMSADTDDTEGR